MEPLHDHPALLAAELDFVGVDYPVCLAETQVLFRKESCDESAGQLNRRSLTSARSGESHRMCSRLFRVLERVFPFLNSLTDLATLSLTCKDIKDLIACYMKQSKTVVLEGPVAITSLDVLKIILLQRFCPTRVTKLVLRNIHVELHANLIDDVSEWELSSSDLRARTVPFPLHVLTHYHSLREFVVESTSTIRTICPQETFNFRVEQKSAPLQIGLANLFELARSCPELTTLSCFHAEIGTDGAQLTDIWGPDCTSEALRRLQVGCPKLVYLGVISSPGPRILREMRRMSDRIEGLTISNRPDFREAFQRSLLEDLKTFPCLSQVIVALTSTCAPGATGRNSVHNYRHIMASSRNLAGGSDNSGPVLALGELGDVPMAMNDFPIHLQLQLLYRSPVHRLQARGRPECVSMADPPELHILRGELATFSNLEILVIPSGGQVTTRKNLLRRPTLVPVSQVPRWQSYMTEESGKRSRRTVDTGFSNTLPPRTPSFVIDVRTEPHLHRTTTQISESSVKWTLGGATTENSYTEAESMEPQSESALPYTRILMHTLSQLSDHQPAIRSGRLSRSPTVAEVPHANNLVREQ